MTGFTLVEIMIVVAIIGLLAAIAIPNFLRARSTSQMNACINNLRQIDSAKQQWALEYGKTSTASPSSTALMPFLGRGSGGSVQSVVCPLAGPGGTFAQSYTIGNMSTTPLCIIGGVGGSAYNSLYPHTLPN